MKRCVTGWVWIAAWLAVVAGAGAQVGGSDPVPGPIAGVGGVYNEYAIAAEKYAEYRPGGDVEAVGRVTDILMGDYIASSPGREIVLVGINGAAYFEETTRQLVRFVPFQAPRNSNTYMKGLDVDGDGELEFVEKGGYPTQPHFTPRVFDTDGTLMWEAKAARGRPVHMELWRAGGRSGPPMFLLGREDSLQLVDTFDRVTGAINADRRLHFMDAVDLTGDDLPEIVSLADGGELIIRGNDGPVLGTGRLPGSPRWFGVTQTPNARGRNLLILPGTDQLGLFNFDGSLVVSLHAPYCAPGRAGLIEGLPVRLVAGRGDYLAILVQYPAWERSLLYVYNAQAALVYVRSVPGYVTSLGSFEAPDGRVEYLFTGGNSNIYHNRVVGPDL